MKSFSRIYFFVLLILLLGSTSFGDEFFPPAELQRLGPDVKQAIVVHGHGPNDLTATLSVWQRREEGNQWQNILPEINAVVGRNGIAPLGEKREGDGRTPSGIFSLQRAFGYGREVKTGLSYQQVTENDLWIDDVASPQYNQWVKAPSEAQSFERLKRDDDLYKYGIVVEYNTNPVVPGKGSAIFIHVWRGPQQPTAGCVALSEENILKLLDWLGVVNQPVIIVNKEAI
jgi:L,D-peptidoglycan transpeptidase YkuD (ErfK/YbiS/YcfS/YnhG family)